MIRQIGITGGIGSGKTTVCKIFVVLGIPVYYADLRAKQLMNSDPELKQQIKNRFGVSVYDPKLNTQALADLVFEDSKALEDLNALVHPAVLKDYSKWYEAQKSPYVIKEAALLYESGSHEQLDEIIVVEADTETRIRRVMDRDGTDRASVEARMNKQDDPASKAERADHLILNHGNTPLIPQVLTLHQKFLDQN